MRPTLTLAVLLPLLVLAPAAHALTHYAVTLVENQTDEPVAISYRWGTGVWRKTVIKPHKTGILAFRFARAGQDVAPRLIVRMGTDRKNPRASQRTFTVEAHACADKLGRCGRRYGVVYGDEPRWLELHDLD